MIYFDRQVICLCVCVHESCLKQWKDTCRTLDRDSRPLFVFKSPLRHIFGFSETVPAFVLRFLGRRGEHGVSQEGMGSGGAVQRSPVLAHVLDRALYPCSRALARVYDFALGMGWEGTDVCMHLHMVMRDDSSCALAYVLHGSPWYARCRSFSICMPHAANGWA